MSRASRGGPGANAAETHIETLLDELDTQRGARDTVVIPIPSQSPAVLPEIRSTVQDILAEALPPDVQKEVQLVCSELVTNALTYGEPPMRLVLHEAEHDISVAVFDRGPGQPALPESRVTGLHIVDELSRHRWGVIRRDGGKWVWATIERTSDAAR